MSCSRNDASAAAFRAVKSSVPSVLAWAMIASARLCLALISLTDKATILLHRPISSDIVLIPLCFPEVHILRWRF